MRRRGAPEVLAEMRTPVFDFDAGQTLSLVSVRLTERAAGFTINTTGPIEPTTGATSLIPCAPWGAADGWDIAAELTRTGQWAVVRSYGRTWRYIGIQSEVLFVGRLGEVARCILAARPDLTVDGIFMHGGDDVALTGGRNSHISAGRNARLKVGIHSTVAVGPESVIAAGGGSIATFASPGGSRFSATVGSRGAGHDLEPNVPYRLEGDRFVEA